LVENKERAAARMRDYLLHEQRNHHHHHHHHDRSDNKTKSHKASMEWGVVAVYTCCRSCGAESARVGKTNDDSDDDASTYYREEFAWRQPCLDMP